MLEKIVKPLLTPQLWLSVAIAVLAFILIIVLNKAAKWYIKQPEIEGLKLSWKIAYPSGIIFAVICFGIFLYKTAKKGKLNQD